MRYYFLHRRLADLLIATLLTALVTAIPRTISPFQAPSPQQYTDIGIAILGVSASLLGLVLAASTFLISHLQHPRFRLLRSAKSYKQLPELVSSNLWRFLLTTLATAITLFIKDSFLTFGLVVILFLACWTLTTFSALLWVVVQIYSIPLADG